MSVPRIQYPPARDPANRLYQDKKNHKEKGRGPENAAPVVVTCEVYLSKNKSFETASKFKQALRLIFIIYSKSGSSRPSHSEISLSFLRFSSLCSLMAFRVLVK